MEDYEVRLIGEDEIDVAEVVEIIGNNNEIDENVAALPPAILEENLHEQQQQQQHWINRVGRPKLSITQDQLEAFDDLGFSVTKCASILGVSRHTIINRRNEFGMPSIRNRYTF